MMIIEALKAIKDYKRKAEDLRGKVHKYCAISSEETPTYTDEATQKIQIAKWIQSHSDILKEILALRLAIQRINLSTDVTIELDGMQITKCIAGWIHRRRDLADDEKKIWERLTTRRIQEGTFKNSAGDMVERKIVRFYSQEEKDRRLDALSSEPSLIDSRLEIVNATTALIE